MWMHTIVQNIIECGRWQNIASHMRLCNLCNQNETGDWYYYILECEFFNSFRKEYVDAYFIKRSSALKFGQLMTKQIKLNKICRFIKLINTGVCIPG